MLLLYLCFVQSLYFRMPQRTGAHINSDPALQVYNVHCSCVLPLSPTQGIRLQRQTHVLLIWQLSLELRSWRFKCFCSILTDSSLGCQYIFRLWCPSLDGIDLPLCCPCSLSSKAIRVLVHMPAWPGVHGSRVC